MTFRRTYKNYLIFGERPWCLSLSTEYLTSPSNLAGTGCSSLISVATFSSMEGSSECPRELQKNNLRFCAAPLLFASPLRFLTRDPSSAECRRHDLTEETGSEGFGKDVWRLGRKILCLTLNIVKNMTLFSCRQRKTMEIFSWESNTTKKSMFVSQSSNS